MLPSIFTKKAMIKNLLPFSLLVLLALSGCGKSVTDQVRDGDIIFHTSRSPQSGAIQKATHSKYSHMGIIFLRDGNPFVFEANKTVQYTPLEKWIARGEGGHYVVKRLRDANRVMPPDAVAKLRRAASEFQGAPYDHTFEWSDNRIYCSELVWKIYDRGMGIRIGRLKKLRDFDLSDIAVKTMMKERYGNHVPMEETVISPGEMFSSDVLKVVTKH